MPHQATPKASPVQYSIEIMTEEYDKLGIINAADSHQAVPAVDDQISVEGPRSSLNVLVKSRMFSYDVQRDLCTIFLYCELLAQVNDP